MFRFKDFSSDVLKLESEFAILSDEQLKAVSASLFNVEKDKFGQLTKKSWARAFALVREATFRALGIRQYPSQIEGGVALLEGNVAEMNTGEGKTLMSYFPAYVRALTGENVHVITANDYLADRDANQAKKIFEFLGVSVGCSKHDMKTSEKRSAYAKNITYATMSEIGFDFLRDNLITSSIEKIQRGLNYVIVDEIDHILLDEARVPIVISSEQQISKEDIALVKKANKFVLEELSEGDLEFYGDLTSANLSKEASEKLEAYFASELKNSSNENIENAVLQSVNNAVKALLMKNGEQYTVLNGKIEIINSMTHRMELGRKFSKGLHQALEEKEGLEISNLSMSLAQIPVGCLMSKYKIMSGMTGTASTSKEEFENVYNMEVVKIKPHKKNQRKDHPLALYATSQAKDEAIIKDIINRHQTGQPILVVVSSVEMADKYSELLSAYNLEHNRLDAVNSEDEEQKVAQAGRLNAITIATNMAGRGTDILLGGNAKYMSKEDKKREEAEVIKAGGLYVIGTELNMSQRADDQIKGRAGRQGAVGETKIYCSFEDPVLTRHMDFSILDRLIKKFEKAGNAEIQSEKAKKIMLKAQQTIEAREVASREQTKLYGSVLEYYRKNFSNIVDAVKSEQNFINNMVPELFNHQIKNEYSSNMTKDLRKDFTAFSEFIHNGVLKGKFKLEASELSELFENSKDEDYVVSKLTAIVTNKYNHYAELNEVFVRDFDSVEKNAFINNLAKMWSEYIESIDELSVSAGVILSTSSSFKQDVALEGGKRLVFHINNAINEFIEEKLKGLSKIPNLEVLAAFQRGKQKPAKGKDSVQVEAQPNA